VVFQCVYHFFVHLSVNGHFGCFHVLVIVNSSALKIELHVSFELAFCLDTCPGGGLLDHMATLFLVFLGGTSVLFSIVAAPIYIPTNSVGGLPFLHTLLNIRYL